MGENGKMLSNFNVLVIESKIISSYLLNETSGQVGSILLITIGSEWWPKTTAMKCDKMGIK